MGKLPALRVKTFVFEKKSYTLKYSELQQRYVFEYNIQNNPLHLGAYLGDVALVKAALASPEADLNTLDAEGNTPLHSALLHGQRDVVAAILESYKTNKDVKAKGLQWRLANKDGNTVLHLAAKQPESTAVQLLLAHKQGRTLFQVKNTQGLQPLDVAVIQGAEAAAQYLWSQLPKGYEPVLSYTSLAIEKEMWGLLEQIITDNPKYVIEVLEGNKTLLHVVAEKNKPKALEVLQKGLIQLALHQVGDLNAWLNCQDNLMRSSALHTALLLERFEVADALLDNYGKLGLSVDLKNKHGATALHIAAKSEKYARVFLKIVQLTKDVNVLEEQHFTPLYYALRGGFFKAVYVLLSYGAKISDPTFALDAMGFASAQLSTQKDVRFMGLMRVLGQFHTNAWEGGDVSLAEKEGFFQAVHAGDLVSLENQYKKAPLLHLKDKEGLTALHHAVKSGQLDVVRWLLQNEAPVNAVTDKGGFAPVYLAGVALAVALKKGDPVKILNSFEILKCILQAPSIVLHKRANFLGLMPEHHEITVLVTKLLNDMSQVWFLFNKEGSEKIGMMTRFGHQLKDFKDKQADFLMMEAKALLGLNGRYMENQSTLLHYAVLNHYVDLTKALLEDPEIDVNVQDIDGYTPLHFALLYKDPAIVALLLQHKNIRVDLKSNTQEYPLHYAASTLIAFFKPILDLYPQALYVQDVNGLTPVGRLFHENTISSVPMEVLETIDFTVPCKDNIFPIHCVADGGIQDARVRRLIVQASPVNALCDHGTALHIAIANNKVELSLELLADEEIAVNAQDKEGNTPLHLACLSNNAIILDALLQHSGIAANISNKKGQYPLHASFKLSIENLQKVFALYPEAANFLDVEQMSPVGYVLREGLSTKKAAFLDRVRFYLQQAIVDFCVPCSKGFTPLMMVVNHNFPEDIMTTLCKRSDVNFFYSGGGALTLAVEQNDPESIRILLNSAALDVNKQDSEGNTALHTALSAGYYEIAELLLKDSRVRGDIKNDKNQYPLHFARTCKRDMLERVFHLYPEAVNVPDQGGVTPMGYVIGKEGEDKTDCLAFLLDQPQTNLKVPCTHSSYPLHFVAIGSVRDLRLQLRILDNSDVNVANKEGLTAFHYAAASKDVEQMHKLLQAAQPLDVGHLDKNGDSALNKVQQALDAGIELADKRRNRYLRDLLEQYEVADLFVKSDNKHQRIIQGVKDNAVFVVESYFAQPQIATLREEGTGYTLLHLAVIYGHMTLVNHFNDLGVAINARDAVGRTALHYAALKADPVMLLALLSRQYVNVGMQDNEGKTALDVLPTDHPQYVTCATLLELMKVTLIQDQHTGVMLPSALTNLVSAIICSKESSQEVQTLMEKIGLLGWNAHISEHSGTALHAAIQYQKHELFLTLLNQPGCSLTVKDGYGRTPLMYAVECGDAFAASLLVMNLPESVREQDESGFTALHIAVLRDMALQRQWRAIGTDEVALPAILLQNQILANMMGLRVLLNNKADLYCPNEEGKIPFAAALSSPEIVKLCLESEQVLDRAALAAAAKTYDLLHSAVHFGNIAVLTLLLDIPELLPLLDSVDREGNTPVHHAIDHYIDPTILALLWEKGKGFIQVDRANNKGMSVRSAFVQYQDAEMQALWDTITADLEKANTPVPLPGRMTNKEKLAKLQVQLLSVTSVQEVESLKDLASPKHKVWNAAAPQILWEALTLPEDTVFKAVVDNFELSDYVSAELLQKALQDPNLQIAARLCSVMPTGKLKKTLLHTVIQAGRLDLVSALLQTANPAELLKASNQEGHTPLESALLKGDRDLCQRLLKTAEQCQVNFLEALPLNKATLTAVIVQGEVELLNQWMMAKGQKAHKMEMWSAVLDAAGNTALHLACLHEQSQMVERLLTESTHEVLYQPNMAGQTVIRLLAAYPNVSVPTAWQEPPFETLSFEAQMQKITTAIAKVTKIEDVAAIQALLRVVSKNNAKQLKKQQGALLKAALQIEAVACLRAVVEDLDLQPAISHEVWQKAIFEGDYRLLPMIQTDRSTKNTVWHQTILAVRGLGAAVTRVAFSQLKEQLQFHQLFNRVNQAGYTPVMLAMDLSCWDILGALLETACALHIPLVDVLPPTRDNLLKIFTSGEVGLLELLLKDPAYRAWLQQADEEGNTALHLACLKGSPKMISALLRESTYEAVHQPNHAGQTVMSLLAVYPEIQVPEGWGEVPFEYLSSEAQLQKLTTAITKMTQIADLSTIQAMLDVLSQKGVDNQQNVFLRAALKIKDDACFKAIVEALGLQEAITPYWQQAIASGLPVAKRLLPFVQTDLATQNTLWHQAVWAMQGQLLEIAVRTFCSFMKQPQGLALLNQVNKAGQTPMMYAMELEDWGGVNAFLLMAGSMNMPVVEVLPATRENLLKVLAAGPVALLILERLLSDPAYASLLEPADAALLPEFCKKYLITEVAHTMTVGLSSTSGVEPATDKPSEEPQIVVQEVVLDSDHAAQSVPEDTTMVVPQSPERPVVQELVLVPVTDIWGAIQQKDFAAFVHYLQMPGLDVHQHNAAGNTLLHEVMYRRQWLAHWVASKLPTTAVNQKGNTALLTALLRKDKVEATLLVQAEDAPVNVATLDGMTPLALAVECNYIQILAILLEKGADPEHVKGTQTLPEVILARADRKHLMEVVAEKVQPALLESWNLLLRLFKDWRNHFNLSLFSKLIQRMNVNVQDPETGNTALHYSFLPGTASPDAAHMLLSVPHLAVNIRNHHYDTPATLFFTYGAGHLNHPVQYGLAIRGAETRVAFPPNPPSC